MIGGYRMFYRKVLCAALSALLIWTAGAAAAGSAEAGAPSMDWFEEKGLTLGESSVAYPALKEGAAEEALRETVNERILEDGKIRDYLTRISLLISGGKLKVSWQGTVLGPVFSFGTAAEGAVETFRNTHVRTGGNIDLRDGHEVTAEELFTDPEAARERMEEYLEENVAPELSAHLLNSEVAPLPDAFRMTERGLVAIYPLEQLSTLSDRAGELMIPWQAVRDLLDPDETGIPAAMGILSLPDAAESGERIRAAAAAGEIPGVPAKLGDGLQALTDEYGMLTDPDVYALGRMFSLEGAGFQNVFLLTDYLTESWENSRVDGIRADEGGLFGLQIGETAREAWRGMLGEPDSALEFDEENAEAWRTVPGIRDYYECGGHRLVLHGDEEGILTSILLMQ